MNTLHEACLAGLRPVLPVNLVLKPWDGCGDVEYAVAEGSGAGCGGCDRAVQVHEVRADGVDDAGDADNAACNARLVRAVDNLSPIVAIHSVSVCALNVDVVVGARDRRVARNRLRV